MIYEAVANVDPIQQGDIFHGIPRVDFSMSRIDIIEEESTRQISWKDLLDEQGNTTAVAAVLPVRSVDAIVITQNCDAARGEYLCLCQIDDFLDATGKTTSPPKNPNKWQSLITQHSRANLRWFYLPEYPNLGFRSRKAVDFRVVLRVARSDLEALKDLRIARLNDLATEHFRETLGQFFRRYPYDEWYPLNKEEFHAYAESKGETVQPFPWQQ